MLPLGRWPATFTIHSTERASGRNGCWAARYRRRERRTATSALCLNLAHWTSILVSAAKVAWAPGYRYRPHGWADAVSDSFISKHPSRLFAAGTRSYSTTSV
jgi:hypothetical protein